MNLTRADYQTDLVAIRASRHPPQRAKGDNFHVEENVGVERIRDFETFAATDPGLLGAAAEYFFTSVQGARRGHVPSTFRPINAPALLPAGIARNQKLVRLERIDDALASLGHPHDFVKLRDAVAGRNSDGITPLIRIINGYRGERPAFVCCRAEVADDLRASDWLWRLIARLGLGHFALAAGETASFALLEYTVEEVFRQTTLTQPFAVPTVLEARNSEFFYPAPGGIGYGYTVDLDHGAARPSVREILHVRLQYRPEHIVGVRQLLGPTPTVHLATARDAHLDRLRTDTGRTGYGEMMTGHVD